MKPVPEFAAHFRASDGEWQSLTKHLRGVATLSAGFASKIGMERVGELLGLLHDLGKYSGAFQNYLKSATGALNQDEDEDWVDAASLKGKVDHSTAGAQLAWDALRETGPTAVAAAQILALCVASHHSGLIDCIAADETRLGEDGFSKRMNKPVDKTHLHEARERGDPEILRRCAQLLRDPAVAPALTGLLRSIGEFNRSETGAGPQATFQQFGLAVRFLFSCLIDADRVDTADFEHPRAARFRPTGDYTAWHDLIERLELYLTTVPQLRPIDGLRREISDHCQQAAGRPKGVYTLTVPTGGGKTLASLRFALLHAKRRQLDRVIFVIPFTSIIDQNAQVVRSILEPPSVKPDQGRVVLEHHGSVTPEYQTWREKILCENWDAPVVYTTMVQFLESLFGAGTRGARRMHQLANATLVFDEIQTLPISCVHLFNNAINFLVEQCNSTVVLCTATQPLLHKVNAARGALRLSKDHELMPHVHTLFEQLKRVEVLDRRRAGGWSHAEVAGLAIEEVTRATSCLVIVNTKAAAREVFKVASASLEGQACFHLSTDMCPAHRKEELAKVRACLDEGRPILCVSTQLIEAGVDVDFGAVVRLLAGLDSIAQAAGRCNRSGRLLRGTVHLVNPQIENLDRLPDISIGRDKAQRVLSDYAQDPSRYGNNLVGPQALDAYYGYYFFARQQDMSYSLAADDIGHSDTLLDLLSTNGQAMAEHQARYKTLPALPFRQAFMTGARAFKAIDAPTQGIVVPHGQGGRELINDLCGAFAPEREFDLLRAAQQYTVNVFPHVLHKLKEAGAVYEVSPDMRILHLNPRYYSPRFGLSTDPVSAMETLNA
jgi:CRISPR-associated endonuclease/helicase Cas3